MTCSVIMSRPEYIMHGNSNKNDRDKGIINKHALIAHLFVSPLLVIKDLGGLGDCIKWRSLLPRN